MPFGADCGAHSPAATPSRPRLGSATQGQPPGAYGTPRAACASRASGIAGSCTQAESQVWFAQCGGFECPAGRWCAPLVPQEWPCAIGAMVWARLKMGGV
jgi:hypothetical protein